MHHWYPLTHHIEIWLAMGWAYPLFAWMRIVRSLRIANVWWMHERMAHRFMGMQIRLLALPTFDM